MVVPIYFEEKGKNSWVGKRVRRPGEKGKEHGTVIKDVNGLNRILTVEMDNSEENETIRMSNTGPDPKATKQWEFESGDKWYSF